LFAIQVSSLQRKKEIIVTGKERQWGKSKGEKKKGGIEKGQLYGWHFLRKTKGKKKSQVHQSVNREKRAFKIIDEKERSGLTGRQHYRRQSKNHAGELWQQGRHAKTKFQE